MHPHRVVEKLHEAVLEITRTVVIVDGVMHIPIAPEPDRSVLYDERVTGQQLLDTVEEGGLTDRVLKCQIFGERFRIAVDLGQKRQQRLRLRREHEQIALASIVKRLYAEPVARTEQALAAVIPDREGKHPATVVDAAE